MILRVYQKKKAMIIIIIIIINENAVQFKETSNVYLAESFLISCTKILMGSRH